MSDVQLRPLKGDGASWMPHLVVGLLVAAWTLVGLGRYHANTIELLQHAAEDVYDALIREASVARIQWPYFTIALMLDVLAMILMLRPSYSHTSRVNNLFILLIWFPSIGLHGIGWAITSVFAG